MKHRISTLRLPHGAAAALAVTALAAGVSLALPSAALADGTVGTITYYQGTDMPHKVLKDYTDCNDLIKDIGSWATASKVTKTVVSVDVDWTANTRIDIPAGTNVVIKLNGHMINRNKATTSFIGEAGGEAIIVRNNATLTVEGGNKSTKHYGTLSNDNTFWHTDLNGTTAITGGLITGGAAAGSTMAAGGITMLGDKAKLYLNDVTIAGNVADTSKGKNGCGGGIRVEGDESTLELKNSSVSYNHAVSDGGGVYVYGNDSTVKIADGSKIDGNFSEDAGGGIAHFGKRGSVTVSGKSSIAYNIAKMRGGGVHSCYNGTSFTLDNSEVSHNDAGQGETSIFKNSKYMGGGFFFEDVSTLSLKNGALIGYNTASGGAGVYVNDDDTTVSLSGASKIKGNVASTAGGGITLTDDDNKIVLTGGSQICENTARYGAGINLSSGNVFTAADMTVELSGNSSICNNKASSIGGGIYSSRAVRKDTLVVKSPDGTGTIAGNVATKGGGAYIEDADFVLEGISITGNSATEAAGGIAFTKGGQLVQYGSGRITLKGTIKVIDNYCNGNASNIAFATPLKGDASDPLAADSRIGVGFYSSDGSSDSNQVTEDTAILKKLGSDFDGVFFADEAQKHVVKGSDGLLYIEDGATKHFVKALGANDDTTYLSCTPNDTVSLKSSAFPKAGYTLDYWELETADGKETYYPADGVTTFKMPGYDVTARAHYAQHLSNIALTLRENSAWDKLGEDLGNSYSSAVSLTAATGESYGFNLASDVSQAFAVTNVGVQELEGGNKQVVYTVKMKKDALDTLGMRYEEKTFKNATVHVRASFGGSLDNAVKVAEDSEGNLIMTATVTFSGTGKSVTVSAVNANKIQGAAFDNVTELISSLNGGTSSDGAGIVVLTPPSQPGWEFERWDNLPQGATEDPKTHVVIMSEATAAGANIVALYKPLASTISLTVDDLVVGEAFPSTVKECFVTGAAERDISKYVSSAAKVTWTKADGSAAGDVVEGDTEYEGTIAIADGTSSGYLYGFGDSVYITVNGEEASTGQSDSDSSVKNVLFKVHTKSDTRFDSVVSGGVCSIYSMDELDGVLPASISYKLKNGTIKTADVVWDTKNVDKSQSNGVFEVAGTFKDSDGNSHSVSEFVYFAVMDAPAVVYEQATDDASAQRITFKASDNWKQDIDYMVYYRVVKYNDLNSIDANDRSAFDEYSSPVTIGSGDICLAYAKLKASDGSESDTGVEFYGRSLEFATVTSSKAAYGSDELQDCVKVMLGDDELVQGVDYIVDYASKAAVGKAEAVVYACNDAFTGYKLFSYKVTPAKVKGVSAAKAGKGKVKVSWNKHKAQTSGYQVRYAASKAKLAAGKGKAVKVKDATKKTVTLKKLKSGKKCYVQVRAYKKVDGKIYWSAWSKVAVGKAK